MNPTKQCPKCGNYAEGHKIETFERKATKAVGKKATSMATGAAIGSIVPGIGTLVGGAIGALVGDAMSSNLDDVNDMIHGKANYEFRCAKCGHTWIVNGKNPMYPSDEIIRNHKQEKVNELEGTCISMGIYTLFSGAASASSFYYCYTHESSTPRTVEGNLFSLYQDFVVYDWNYLWYFLAFIFVITAFITFGCLVGYVAALDKYSSVKKYSLHKYYDKYMK